MEVCFTVHLSQSTCVTCLVLFNLGPKVPFRFLITEEFYILRKKLLAVEQISNKLKTWHGNEVDLCLLFHCSFACYTFKSPLKECLFLFLVVAAVDAILYTEIGYKNNIKNGDRGWAYMLAMGGTGLQIIIFVLFLVQLCVKQCISVDTTPW